MKNTFSKVPKNAETPMNADLMDSPQKDLYIAKKVDVKIKRLNGTTMFTILFALFLAHLRLQFVQQSQYLTFLFP